jgi:hypothetical protein
MSELLRDAGPNMTHFGHSCTWWCRASSWSMILGAFFAQFSHIWLWVKHYSLWPFWYSLVPCKHLQAMCLSCLGMLRAKHDSCWPFWRFVVPSKQLEAFLVLSAPSSVMSGLLLGMLWAKHDTKKTFNINAKSLKLSALLSVCSKASIKALLCMTHHSVLIDIYSYCSS